MEDKKDLYTFYLADGRMVDVEAVTEEEAYIGFVTLLEEIGLVQIVGKKTIH